MEKHRTYTATASAQSFTKWIDYKMLVKVNLSTVVVITSVLAYAIASGEQFSMFGMSILAIGGFLVTAAANSINQVLEKDFDKLMARTANRPVTAGRMKSSEAVMFAGISCLVGICMLAMFNPLTALLGMLSFVTYSFVYTPLKRYSTVAVAIGAIPGALPVLIGCTAFEGTISIFAVSLFMIQFLWQFPHFWAIGYLSYDDYSKAGYKLLPEENGAIHRDLGKYSLIYTILIIPVIAMLFYLNIATGISTIVAIAATLIYIYYCWNFHKSFDKSSARALMFCSFFYMPIVLLAYMIF